MVSCVQGKFNQVIRDVLPRLPAIVRFAMVGGTGLLTDMLAFTVAHHFVGNPFTARLFSLAVATAVTWTLNRHLTFEIQDRAVSNEAMRYCLVTLIAQGFSYSVFATLVTLLPHVVPQVALLAGALAGALLSFNGHRILSFAPIKN